MYHYQVLNHIISLFKVDITMNVISLYPKSYPKNNLINARVNPSKTGLGSIKSGLGGIHLIF